jgi:hypothetical protein
VPVDPLGRSSKDQLGFVIRPKRSTARAVERSISGTSRKDWIASMVLHSTRSATYFLGVAELAALGVTRTV